MFSWEKMEGVTRIICVACGIRHERPAPTMPPVSCDHLIVGPFLVLAEHEKMEACSCGCGQNIYHGVTALPTSNIPEVIADDDDDDDEKVGCEHCGDLVDIAEVSEVHERYDDYSTQNVCDRCRDSHYTQCPSCNECVHDYRTTPCRTNYGNNSASICRPCRDGERGTWSILHCDHCGEYFDDEEPCCNTDEDGIVSGCDCGDCENSRRSTVVHDYSYKPSPVFHRAKGEQPTSRRNRFGEDYDTTLYMGIELEVESSGDGNDVTVQDALGDLVYLKDDSSINSGFEIVSHPATFDYWMNEFRWDAIRKLRGDGVIGTSTSCGLHVHVSKNAFSSAAHEYRWIMFWHRNQVMMKVLAGRDSSYGSYDNDQRKKLVKVVKNGDHSYRRSAINTQNEFTHEVRVFASTVYVNRIKAAIQLVESTVEYTRHLAAAKVMKDGGYSWVEFIVYLRSKGDRYQHLIKRIVDLDIDKEPKFATADDRFEWCDDSTYKTIPGHVVQEGTRA